MLPIKLAIISYKFLINIFHDHTNSKLLFNRNNVKVSYSSLPNFSSIINSHNKKILRQREMALPKPQCNCRVKESCPLNSDCLQSSVVYSCKITSNNTTEDSPHYWPYRKHIYTFKDRLYKRINSFKCETKKNSTKPSNYLWDKKKDKQEISFRWYIKEKAKSYSPVPKRCKLCLSEKYHILFSEKKLLNKQNEIILKYRPVNKQKLGNSKI